MIADLIPKIAEFEDEENLPYSPRISMSGPTHDRGEDTRCIRAMLYHRMAAPASPLPGRALIVFSDSSWHEELTKDWLRKSVFQVHGEQMHVSVDLGLPFMKQRTCKTKISGQPCGQIIPAGHIAGHMDFLLGNPEGKDILIEHKAINHFTFERIWRGEIPLDYVFQASLYLQGLQPINPIDYALLLIKNKNNSAYVEIEIEYIPENQHVVINGMMRSNGDYQEINKRIGYSVVAESAAKFGEVEERFQSKTLPPRPYEMDSWRCQYCVYNQDCWEGYDKEFEALATDVAMAQDLEETCKYYLELSEHLSSMNTEKEELKEKIKKAMKDKGLRKGYTELYNATLSLRKWTGLNNDLIPPKILEAATISKPFEMLTIRLRNQLHKPRKQKDTK